MLPSYLCDYHIEATQKNPEALIAMQLDDGDCFFLTGDYLAILCSDIPGALPANTEC
jgi:hypothetical protein